MSQRYRQLLPVSNSDNHLSNSHPSGSSFASWSSSYEPLKRQRIGTQLACNGCRKRKIRCDGQRPLCEACRRRGEKDACTYANSRNQGQTSEQTDRVLELFDLLKSGSESQAIDILQTIRCHNDLETALSIVQARREPGRLASGREWTRISPSHLGLEHELMAKNPMSFPSLRPFESRILEAALGTGRLSTTENEDTSSSPHSKSNPFPVHHPTRHPRSTLRPCDERLEDLDLGFWTSVACPNDLATKIISLYLETDHPLLGTFDPDLFVDDLVSCRLRPCSRLLVSVIMYWGCQMYSDSDPTVKKYIPEFSEEAEARWSEEKSTDSLLNLAGTQLLGLAYLGDGKDHYVLTYVSEANAMGTRMGLFGVDPLVASSKVGEVTPELRNATSYAAWGTFNWIVLMSLFYQQPGLSYPEHPPMLPIPRYTWRSGSDDSSESVPETLQSAYMGGTFPALCRFWRIIHEVTLRYYRDQPYPRERLSGYLSLAFAECKYRELIALVETLPPSVMRSEDSPHHVYVFHIWLHTAILNVLRPFTLRARSASRPLRLKTFSSRKASVDAAYKASVNQLKRLTVVYHTNYVSSTYTMLWHTALIHLVNAVLSDTKDPTWRFYLIFCIRCYGHLRQAYRFAETIGRSLITMTLQKGDLSTDEARHLMQQFEENTLSGSSEDIRATFMADLNLAMTEPEEASVERLAERFEDIALFREFTNREGSSENEPMEDEAVSRETI